VLTNSSPSSDLITVDVHGNWGSGWNGWLVVAGSIHVSGNITMNGLLYAQNDVTLHGAGGGSITGAVISTNRVDTNSTNVDTDDIGNAPISYNCPSVRSGGGTIPQNWFVKPGTYKEVPAPETRGPRAPGRCRPDGCWMPAAVIVRPAGNHRGRSRRGSPQGVRAAGLGRGRAAFPTRAREEPRGLSLHYGLAICASWLDIRDEAMREFQWVVDHAFAASDEARVAREWLERRE